MIRTCGRTLALLVLAACLGPSRAWARTPGQLATPKNEGWVTDLAHLLTATQERDLEQLMESYRAGTTHEIALLTVPSLGGDSIERFALQVGRDWQMGQAGKNNAALLVVAKDDRKLRIEVGRGLEGALPDSIAGRIIRDVIAPEFKRRRFYEGLRAGIEAMHAAIGGDYAKIPERRARSDSPGLGFLVMIAVFGLVFVLSAARRRHRRTRFGGAMSALPWILLSNVGGRSGRHGGFGGHGGGGGGGGGFGGFGGGGGFSGGGASGGW